MIRIALAAAALAAIAVPAAASPAGQRHFSTTCGVCHKATSTPLAPTLAGVAGAKIAGRTDFNYSAGLKKKQGTWTRENLDAFLKSPTAFAPGTKMVVGASNPAVRAEIVDYLMTGK